MGEMPEISSGVIACQVFFSSRMRDGVTCYRIPSLATAPNGNLAAAIDERVSSCDNLGDHKDINVLLTTGSSLI